MDSIFESLENALQVITLIICGIYALVRVHLVREKSWLLLFFFYGSFLLGDLYWQVCLLCLGDIPKVSIVSDLSWYAAYMFLYLLLKTAGEGPEGSKVPAASGAGRFLPCLGPVFTAVMTFLFIYIQNGNIIINVIYAVLMGILLFSSIKGLMLTAGDKDALRSLYRTVFAFCLLEYALWTSSCLWDIVVFRYIYCGIDLMITLSFVRLLLVKDKGVRS